MPPCIFCKIISGELPSSKVHEDDHLLAFLDIQPINPGHALIIPKQHHAELDELPAETLGRMMALANRINQALRASVLKPEGVNLLLCDGKAAGQEVFHVHLHVIPRYTNDGFRFGFRTDHKNKPKREELNLISLQIQSKLN